MYTSKQTKYPHRNDKPSCFASTNKVIYLLSHREQFRTVMQGIILGPTKAWLQVYRNLVWLSTDQTHISWLQIIYRHRTLDIAPYQRLMSYKLVLSWGRRISSIELWMIFQPWRSPSSRPSKDHQLYIVNIGVLVYNNIQIQRWDTTTSNPYPHR